VGEPPLTQTLPPDPFVPLLDSATVVSVHAASRAAPPVTLLRQMFAARLCRGQDAWTYKRAALSLCMHR
jgi:hypothetical protein